MVAIAAAIAGCGNKKDAPAAAAAPAKAAAPAVAPAKESVAKPAAPARVEVALPSAVKLSPPTPMQIAGKTVTSEPCKLDKRAPDLKADHSSEGIIDLALGTDGALYALDGQHQIRKYVVQSASPCELALDTKWGKNGLLTVDDKDAEGVVYLSVDAKGTLYASGNAIHRIGADGKVTPVCSDQPGRLLIDAATGTAYLDNRQIVLDDSCAISDVPAFKPLRNTEIIDISNGQVFAKFYVDDVEKDGVFEGGRQLAQLAPGDGDDSSCRPDSIAACAGGACAASRGCDKLRAFGRDGKLVAAADLKALLGVPAVWPMRIVTGKDATWIAYTLSGDQPPDDNFSFGMISRVTGL
jgi:hypothetical protein